MAGGGGGAWKVAYADFVTAMMAFFLVMWICGQDQQVRKAVSYYFNDPTNTSLIGNSRQPNRTGAITDTNATGSVPLNESVALGRGRKSFTSKGEKTPATKAISDWLMSDEKSRTYWEEKAQHSRKWAVDADDVRSNKLTVEEAAALNLAKSLRNEATQEITGKGTAIQQDLLVEVLAQVNWFQLAEDLLQR